MHSLIQSNLYLTLTTLYRLKYHSD